MSRRATRVQSSLVEESVEGVAVHADAIRILLDTFGLDARLGK